MGATIVDPVHGAVPATVQVAVRWGTTVLTSRRFERRAQPVAVTDEAALVWGPRGLELVSPQGTWALFEGALLRRKVGALELTVDTRGIEPAVFGRWRPEGRFLSSDVLSLIVHVGLALLMLALRAPVTDAEMDLPAPIAAEPSGAVLVFATRDPHSDSPPEASDGGVRGAGAAAEHGATGSGRTPMAAPGLREAVQQGRAAAPPLDRGRALRDAASFGMIGLLPSEDESPPSPWSGDDELAASGTADGPSWGVGAGAEGGIGGLGLSGVGEGAGGRGFGVGRGDLSYVYGVFAFGVGRLGGSHSVRGPRLCSQRPENGCASVTVSGRLPPETVQRAVRQSFGRFRACYSPLLRENPSLTARVAVHFVIGRDGAVQSASGSGDAPNALTSCVVKAFYGVSFPPPEGGVVSVTYPITFSPE